MPANLSPEYKNAEAAFRQAREPKQRLDCLREMLRTIPKHKGTERLQADIKSRIKQLTEELSAPRKGASRSGPVQSVRPEGAAQVALLGAPNSGKSALHARLTGSHAEVGPYPYTTREPQPGMLPYQDIHFQLLDLPPLSREHPLPWIGNTLQTADAALLVVDLGDPACVENVLTVRGLLADKHVTLLDSPALAPGRRANGPKNSPKNGPENSPEDGPEGGPASSPESNDDGFGDPFAIRLPTLLVATKADAIPGIHEELEVLEELIGARYPAQVVSVESGGGLEGIAPWLFETLGIVRVYTKAPGRPCDKDQPFTVRRGDTVRDVATLVHRELAGRLRYARLWGESGQFSGQQVGRDHPVADGDILELHA